MAEHQGSRPMADAANRLFAALIPPSTLTAEEKARMKAIAPLAGQQASTTPESAPSTPETRMALLRQMAGETH